MSGERDAEFLTQTVVETVATEGLTVAVVYSWAHGLVHDVIARAVAPAGRLPRAAYVDPDQEPLPWGVIPAFAFPETARAYIAKFEQVVVRVARLQRLLAVIEPWLADHEAGHLTTAEVAQLAGAAAEDVAALAA